MIKTKIIETIEKYDKDGKLVEKVTREETSEDDTDYVTEQGTSFTRKNIADCVLEEIREREKIGRCSIFGHF